MVEICHRSQHGKKLDGWLIGSGFSLAVCRHVRKKELATKYEISMHCLKLFVKMPQLIITQLHSMRLN